jgi:hypothetical protein
LPLENSPQYPVLYKGMYGNPQFYHIGNRIRFREVCKIISTDAEADGMMKSGRTQRVFGYLMAGTGGYILGYNMHNPDPQLRSRNLVLGGAITGGAILVDLLSKKKIKSAIDLYNTNVKSQIHNDLSLSLGLCESGNGIGLKFSF